jgi:predicted O-methyltransferase YrrM
MRMLWRVRRLVERHLEDRRGLRMADIEVLRCDEGRSDFDGLIARIIAEGRSFDSRATASRVERDKADTARALGDRKQDLRPFPWQPEKYVTEAEALIGCATPRIGGKLIFGLVRAVRPTTIVEVGAAHGYGALYIGSALRRNERGKLFTLEGVEVRVQMSRAAVKRFGLEARVEVIGGDFATTVPETFRRLRPVDVVFSDGSKEPDETREQFVLAKEAMPSGGYILYDDINFSPEIETLWRNLVRDPRVVAAAAFHGRWGLLALRPV